MKLRALIIASLFATVGAFAQGNLVKNGGFEEVSKKVKEAGQIESAYPWKSLTEAKPDLFTTKSKGEDFGTPKNMYGDGDPKEGGSYAGLVMYSYKDEEPRSYLMIELEDKLEEDKVYCVKMGVMLAMLSKYSCNNIGIHVSEDPIDIEALEAGAITPQIIHSQNKVFEEMFEWTEICQTYIAKGGEEYITIGNFAPTDEVENEKVKKPKGITGSQARSAYYYIDDVSVMNMAGVESCDCEVDASGSSINVVYSKEVSADMEVDVTQDIEMTRIYFAEMTSELSEDAMEDIAKVAALLKEHPKYKVQITGNTDPVEEVKVTGDVSLLRAKAVKDKLVEAGAYENKIQVVGVQDFNPATDDASSAGQAQNRRVEFKVVSKD